MNLSVGTATLMRLPSQQQQLRVLDAALDLGVRHVDTAPLYGFGAAELLLGQRQRQLAAAGVEVTTKVGLSAPRGLVRLNRFVGPVRFALSRSRTLTKVIRARGGGLSQPTELTWAEVESSLIESRRRLGVDRLDVVLLHERSAADLSDELVAAWTHRLPDHADRSGVAAKGDWAAVAARLGPGVAVVQVAEWATLEHVTGSARRRAHGALRDVATIAARLDGEPSARALLEEASGVALRSAGDVARALVSLHAATGLVDELVVGSTSTAHWQALAAAARTPAGLDRDEAARLLARLTSGDRPAADPER